MATVTTTPTTIQPVTPPVNTAPAPDISSTIGSINSQINSINSSSGANLPQVTLPKTLSSATLAPQPSFTVTQPQTSTAGAGLGGALAATVAQNQASLDKSAADAAAAGGPGGSSLQSLMDALSAKQGVAQQTSATYANTVDPAQKELQDVNNQLVAEQVATRHQIEALKANPNGAFGTGLQDRIDQIQSQSLSRQADIAVVQLAKQGAYDSAKAIADRAVAASVEAQQNKIDALNLSYQANKDQYTKAEQRDFEAKQKTLQAAVDEKTYETRAKYDELIKVNDPQYQATLAKTQAEVAGLGGGGTLNVNGTNIPANLAAYYKTSYSNIPYVDLSSATPSDKGKLAQLAARSGIKTVLDTGDALKLNAIADSKTNLVNISEAATSLLGSSGSGQVGAALKNTFLSSFSPDVKSFNAWRTAIINNVQALAGGTGSGLRINKAEIDAAMANDLPVITGTNADSVESAQKKIAILNTQLDHWEKQILGGGNHADGTISVIAPDGTSHIFSDQASADAFKKAAGIK